MEDNKKIGSFLERLKAKAQAQENYGGKTEITEAKMEVRDCPNCGAGRAKQDGVTRCAYCGFEFIGTELTNGIHLRKEDNSKE